ncbi:MAG: PilT/PilU family type 4a pilus ATPase [Planctomycetes bacterium]|nr:PilT/PilU family type 4a pilus ATPase [Planctomycetota bacterium]HON44081.1 PilT/PilU family type 4a pilus ATPase [Planctomycetota bacterium]HPY75736.1 PilT/PilU family type 4a pilus ATPase [Planctomycetota bacterium]HQB01330.1 PilT/PilU family type 4a pilus ATPase [Planctomycetota bacterium]HRU52281.1 PilT/PilU family type 4a pilus ATPase [Planctomycetota bacterium]
MIENEMKLQMEKLLELTVKHQASDLHLKINNPPLLRVKGAIGNWGTKPLEEEELEKMILSILTSEHQKILRESGDVDFAYAIDKARFRINVFKQRGSYSLSARRVNTVIPCFKELHLPQILEKISLFRQGLVLLCGPTGCGKSTTLASMIQFINLNRRCHIVTIEDPIEYVYEDQKSFINQREIGLDVESFPHALRAVLRQDPDVILIGEMRDQETFGTALKAAETGHLVFGTLHSSTVVQTFGRIYDIFPAEERESIRKALMFNLIAVIGQKLAPTKDNLGRIPIHEIMIMNATIQKLIEEKKEGKIGELIRTLEGEGMCDFNQSLYKAIKDGYITDKVALSMSHNPEQLKMNLKGIFVSDSGILA